MPLLHTPARKLLLIALFGLLCSLMALVWVMQNPWLGLELTGDEAPGLRIEQVNPDGPARALSEARRLLALSVPGSGAPVELQAQDKVADPDELHGYSEFNAFMARQQRLNALLSAPAVELHWLDAQGALQRTLVTPTHRPLTALPFLFWYELLCALGGLMIAAWVFVLRPADRAVHFFAITGICMFVTILVNSLYVNRELAMQGIQSLVLINHVAVFLFGCALIDLFLSYPAPLVRARHLLWPWLIYPLWLLLDITQVLPDQSLGMQTALLSQILLVTLLAMLHWRRSRHQPVQRAALLWFVLSFVLAYWLFMFATLVPIALELPMLMPMGYAAGFIFLSYIGLALGISRYRLFELDTWAYRILLTVIGAVVVAGLDVLLIWGLHMNPLLSLGWALFLAGWIYFPLRQWLWKRLIGRTEARLEDLLPDLIALAFTAGAEPREQGWRQLLERLFKPLDQQPLERSPAHTALVDEGLSLRLPACGGLGARELRYADEGKRLFTPSDAEFAQGLCNLMAHAASSREAYERGAAEERGRVYRDLHDDIGAKLLSLVIGAETPARADLARSALDDLRDVVSHSACGAMPLSDLMADWRAEIDNRLRSAGIDLHWFLSADLPDIQVAPEAAMHLGRILREGVSNVLRHARASVLSVDIRHEGGKLCVEMTDNGAGLPATSLRPGKGLINMRKRVELLGGRIDWLPAQPQGCRVRLELELKRLEEGRAEHSDDHSESTAWRGK
ncbi:MAG: hypothetical protein PHF20_00830 [Halothiobacillaceae bacterium]|nr:hypothetical protein [Halothiobacillaceae bacterium]